MTASNCAWPGDIQFKVWLLVNKGSQILSMHVKLLEWLLSKYIKASKGNGRFPSCVQPVPHIGIGRETSVGSASSEYAGVLLCHHLSLSFFDALLCASLIHLGPPCIDSSLAVLPQHQTFLSTVKRDLFSPDGTPAVGCWSCFGWIAQGLV